MKRLLVEVRLATVDTEIDRLDPLRYAHSRAVEIRDTQFNVLEAALEASHAAFELAYQALGRPIGPAQKEEESR